LIKDENIQPNKQLSSPCTGIVDLELEYTFSIYELYI